MSASQLPVGAQVHRSPQGDVDVADTPHGAQLRADTQADNCISERTAATDRREHRCDRDGAGAHGLGTHACYTLCRCRCWNCVAARSEYERQRAKANSYGQSLMVDAGPVRDHVANLMCGGRRGAHHKGVGLKQIAKVSGVANGTLWKLMYGTADRGPSRKVRRATAEKLLAVTLADMADGATVPAGPTQRRLTEMLDAGWAKRHIARHIGIHETNLNRTLTGTKVRAATARAAAELHRRWQDGDIPTEGRRSRWETGR